MFVLLEDTDERLAMRIGSRNGWNASIFTMDKSKGRLTIERKTFFVSRRMIDVPFADVARVDAVTTKVRGNVQHSILIGMKSGKRRWCAADQPETNVRAADRMRAFMALQPVDASRSNPISRLYRWSSIGVTVAGLIVAAAVGFGKASRYFILPECDEQQVLQTFAGLVANGNPEPINFSEVRTVSKARDRNICEATGRRGADVALMDYSTEWNGWTASVRANGAKPYEAVGDDLAAAVKTASDAVLARAKGSDTTGTLPPADAETAHNVDRVFDISDILTARLKDSDLAKLIAWFNEGHAIGAAYVLAGTTYREFKDVPQKPRVQTRIDKNIIDQAPIVGRYLDFEVGILSVIAMLESKTLAPAGTKEPKETTDRVAPFRATLLSAIETTLFDVLVSGATDEWRISRLAAIETRLDVAKYFLTKSQMVELHNRIVDTQSKTASEAVKSRLGAMDGKVTAGT